MNVLNKIVKPNHKGLDMNGRTIDYTVYRGRVVEVTGYDNAAKCETVRVIWFKDAVRCFGKFTSNYPVVDLALA